LTAADSQALSATPSNDRLRSSSNRGNGGISVADMINNGVSEGGRDDSILRLACLLEREGMCKDVVMETVLLVAERCDPPFEELLTVDKVERAFSEYRSAQGLAAEERSIEDALKILQEKKDAKNRK